MPSLWTTLRSALDSVQFSALPDLEQSLIAAAPTLLASLQPRPPSVAELAKLHDPMFEHNGHRLEPLGRQTVLQLSKELNISEISAWDLVQRTASAAPGASVLELRFLAVSKYYAERSQLLLLVLDTLTLASAGPYVGSPARSAATTFLDALNAGPGPTLLEQLVSLFNSLLQQAPNDGTRRRSGPAIPAVPLSVGVNQVDASGGLGPGTGPRHFFLPNAPSSAAAAPVPVEDGCSSGAGVEWRWGEAAVAAAVAAEEAAKAEQLQLICLCIFYGCLYEGGCTPPATLATALLSSLKLAARQSISISNDLVLLSILTLLAPSLPLTATYAVGTTPRAPIPPACRTELTPAVAAWTTAAAAATPLVGGAAGGALQSPGGVDSASGTATPRTPRGSRCAWHALPRVMFVSSCLATAVPIVICFRLCQDACQLQLYRRSSLVVL